MAVICAWISAAFLLCAETGEYTDDQLKLALIYNIAPFVEWPTNAFDSPSAPLILGILGTDPFGSDLEEILGGRSVAGHKFEFKRSENLNELLPCHILFVSSSEKARFGQILEKLADTPILTVSDGEGFPAKGGILYFILENKRVAFEINRTAASRASLKFSAQLLRLARKLHGSPGE